MISAVRVWWSRRSAYLKWAAQAALALVATVGAVFGVHDRTESWLLGGIGVRVAPESIATCDSGTPTDPASLYVVVKAPANGPQSQNRTCALTMAPRSRFHWVSGALLAVALFGVWNTLISWGVRKTLGGNAYIRGDRLRILVYFLPNGDAREMWTYDGVYCEDFEFPVMLDYTNELREGQTPTSITSLDVSSDHHHVELRPPRSASPRPAYRGSVHFTRGCNPPYRFTLTHEAAGAWALTREQFRQRYVQPPCSDADTDCWDLEPVNSWKLVEIDFSNTKRLLLAREAAAYMRRAPGAPAQQIKNRSSHDDDEGWDPKAWRLRLTNVEAGCQISIRFTYASPPAV
jgi:hypothetical protein